MRDGGYCLKTTGGPLTRFALKVNSHFNAVGDLDEGNAAVHSVLFAVERHRAFNGARAGSFAGKAKVSLSCLVTPRMVKSPSKATVSGPICSTFVEWKVIRGFCSTSKKSLLFQFAVFHARFRYPRWRPGS